jgi:hypothetical protein
MREDGGGEGARSSSLSTSCITCTGIGVKDFGRVLLVPFGIDEELRGGGIAFIGEWDIEKGAGLVGLEESDVDAEDSVDEISISDGFFFVSSWNKPPAENFLPP